MELRLNPKKKCAVWGLFGILLTILGFTMLMKDPVANLVRNMIKFTEGSMAHEVFKKIPVDVLLHAYFFNVTNSQEFLSGKDDKIRLKEIGPYVYKERRENLNITFHENGTVSYVPKTICTFVRELSVGDPDRTHIIIPNAPYLGTLSSVSRDPFWRKASVKAFLWTVRPEPFINVTVSDFMWGYEDRLIRILTGLFPAWMDFDKFGVFPLIYSDKRAGIATMNLENGPGSMYSIDRWNGIAGLPEWGYKDDNTSQPCNSFKDVYEGMLLPPNVNSTKRLKVFKKLFCRWHYLDYLEEVESKEGIRGYKYEMSGNSYNCSNPENECFCPKNDTCPLDGVTNLTPCYYGMPVFASFPHFYGGDKRLYYKLDGLKANEEKHRTTVVIQPDLGMPMKMTSRAQLNLGISNIDFVPNMKVFNNMMLPLMWMDGIVDELPPDFSFKLLLALKYMPAAQVYISWILIALGVGIFMWTCVSLILMCLELSGGKSQRAMNYIQVAMTDMNFKEEPRK